MKNFILMLIMMLLASVSAALEAAETYTEVDQEMIQLLGLNPSQSREYVAIMQKQRALLLVQKPQNWQQELAFYHQTFALLRPILTSRQHAQFIGVINSVIEDTGEQELVVMGQENY